MTQKQNHESRGRGGGKSKNESNLAFFPWQEKLIAPLDATLKNVAKRTGIGKAKDKTTLQSKIK